jgi:hypothetical protein
MMFEHLGAQGSIKILNVPEWGAFFGADISHTTNITTKSLYSCWSRPQFKKERSENESVVGNYTL